MIRLSMVLAMGLGVLLFVGGCDGGNACDCKPTIIFSSPTGSNALTEFDDQDLNTNGLQYGVAVQTTCIKAGQKLVLTNDKNLGGDVEGTVVIDDSVNGTGHIDFGNQTFQDGINTLCISGDPLVDHKSDGATSCDEKKQTIESCKGFVVSLNVPACRFENPADNANLDAGSDGSASLPGFQSNVQAICKGVNDGAMVTLIVNGHLPKQTTLSNGRTASWNDTTLGEGSNLLRVETTGTNSVLVAVEIRVTVDTGGCVVRLSPVDGSSVATNPATLTIEVATDTGGTFSCADGSAVTLNINDTNYSGTLADHKASFEVTLIEGNNPAFATVQGGAGQKSGRSLEYYYFGCFTNPSVAFTLPTEGTIFNAASQDSDVIAPDFQVRVELSATVPDGTTATLKVDGESAVIIDNPVPVFSGGKLIFQGVTLVDGAHQLSIQVCDCANNCGDAFPVNILVDRVAPKVAIVDPTDLKQLGLGDDKSAEAGFQYNVECQFTDAAVGDIVTLSRNEGSGMTVVATRQLTVSELSSYTFENATLLAAPTTQGNVQVQCNVRDAAGNSNNNIVTVEINVLRPEVIITRPANNAMLNIYSDMCSQSGFQTQVDIYSYNTNQGDSLILCVCPGTTCTANPGSTDRCEQQGFGTTRYNGVVTGITTAVSCMPFEQGVNTLRAFAENIPGQGTYSDPVAIQIDSLPPTVVDFNVTSDTSHDGCINQTEATLVVQVNVSDPGGSLSLDGQTVTLMDGWPRGNSIGQGTVYGGVATISGSTLAEGVHNLTAVFSDAFGNPNIRNIPPIVLNPGAQKTITVDIQPPTIAITNPIKSSLNSNDDLTPPPPLNFVFTVSTTGVENGQNVTFSPVSGISAVSAGVASYTSSLGDGSYTLQASVSDLCGNAAIPATKDITIDTINPSLTCSSPTSDTTFTTQTVGFECQTGDTDSTQKIKIVSSLTGELPCQPMVNDSGTTIFNCQLQKGTHDLTLTVTDPAGNVSVPVSITDIVINTSGCAIVFQDRLPVEVFNASNDKNHNPADGLQIDLNAHSSDCTNVSVDLKRNGEVVASGLLNGSGDITFIDVTFVDTAAGVTVSVEFASGYADSFLVELVDLYPPTLTRLAPLAPGQDAVSCAVSCVASTGNSTVDGLTVLADKIAGAPCDMDFQFEVTDGGNSSFPGSLELKLGATNLGGPTTIESNPQAVNYTNVQVTNNATNNLVVTATDYAGNAATIDITVTTDVIAPALIIATAALDSAPNATRHADVILNWTAVGDDENTATAAGYDLRWSTDPIVTEADWNSATQITNNLQNPAAPSTAETYLALLPPLNTYHLALRAVDEVGNEGPLPADVSVSNMWNSVTHIGSGGSFGYGMWNIGDVNGDTRDDLAVAAYVLNSNTGVVYIFYGNQDLTKWQNGSGGIAPLELAQNSPGGRFGWDLSSGDLDGDGLKDLVVSERGFVDGESVIGRVNIYFNQGGGVFGCGVDNEYCVEIRGIAGSEFGRSIEVLGNINADNYNDLFASAPGIGTGNGYIFLGRSRDDWKTAASALGYIPITSTDKVIAIVGQTNNDWFGYRWGATTLGDLNADGNSDFALVASGVNKLYTFDGATIASLDQEVSAGTDSVNVLTDNAAIPTDGFRAGFGHRTVGGIDFTGDGLLDLIVADAFSSQVYLFAGKDNSPGLPIIVINPESSENITLAGNVNFGWDLAAGDINMDGQKDLIVGCNSTGGNRAFIFLNTGSSPFFGDSPAPASTLSGVLPDDYFGLSVVVGDFNGDGLPDIVVGANAGNGYVTIYY